MNQGGILVVEDEAVVALDIKSRLEKLGYRVPALAASGEDAVRKAEETQPDLVLMDILLRGDMDGIEAAAAIRERFDIPVVYMTALSDQETLERGNRTSPDGWLAKPVDALELRQVIAKALSRRRQAEEETG